MIPWSNLTDSPFWTIFMGSGGVLFLIVAIIAIIYKGRHKQQKQSGEITGTLITDAQNKNENPKIILEHRFYNGRYIKFAVDGYFENFESFPHSALVIPINDEFDLKTSVKGSIHGDFRIFLENNSRTQEKDVQKKLDRSLGYATIPKKMNEKTFLRRLECLISHIKV